MASPQVILETIRKNPKIPAPSQTVTRVLALTKDPNCEFHTVADVISRDGTLTGQILRQANSALFGTAKPTSSVKEACVRLGLRRVRSAVLNDHIVNGLGKARPPGFHPHRYWQGTLATSVAAQDLARYLRPVVAEDASTAGLLCDIGVGLLAYGVPNEYAQVLKQLDGDAGAELHRIEKRTIGITHPEVGAAVLEDWNLERPIIEAVARHHDEPQEDNTGEADGSSDDEGASAGPLARIVAAAVTCSHIALRGSDLDRVDRLFRQIGTLTHQADALVTRLLDTLVHHIQQTAQGLAVELGNTDEMASNVAQAVEGLPEVTCKMSFKPMDRHHFED